MRIAHSAEQKPYKHDSSCRNGQNRTRMTTITFKDKQMWARKKNKLQRPLTIAEKRANSTFQNKPFLFVATIFDHLSGFFSSSFNVVHSSSCDFYIMIFNAKIFQHFSFGMIFILRKKSEKNCSFFYVSASRQSKIEWTKTWVGCVQIYIQNATLNE